MTMTTTKYVKQEIVKVVEDLPQTRVTKWLNKNEYMAGPNKKTVRGDKDRRALNRRKSSRRKTAGDRRNKV